MCGRFTLRSSPQVLKDEFDLFTWPELAPRFNIAPTQQVPIVRMAVNGQDHEATLMRWGLIPSWADDIKIGYWLINARADGVATKPSFRTAYKQRRCLVPTDGFYEWMKIGQAKQPYHIHLPTNRPFALAGLWEHWHHEAEDIDSFTIITTDANDQVRSLHDRMPVILEKRNYGVWLDPAVAKSPHLQELLKPFVAELVLDPVSTWVNAPAHDDERCLEQMRPA